MTGRDVVGTIWVVPFWLAAAYNWGAGVYYLSKARREEYRMGEEPFIVWRDDCLPPDGRVLRRRGARAMRRFVAIVVGAVLGGALLDWLLRLGRR
jgi:hypothetical protein